MNRNIWLILGAAVLVLLVGAGAWYVLGDRGPEVKLAELTPLREIHSAACTTQVPDGWGIVDGNTNGTLLTLTSSDRAMVANYTVTAVTGPVAQTMPPGAFVQQLATVLTNAPVKIIAGGRDFGGYHVMAIESGRYGGYILFHAFALQSNNAGYGILMRLALGDKNSRTSLATAGSVVAAIRCKAVQMPQPLNAETNSADNHDTGTTAACRAGKCDDSDLAGSFNAQLGTGWVHDSKGRNYNVDVVGAYNDDGPDGPGYYATIDGSREILHPGLN